MATIDDFGGTSDPLGQPALGGEFGWAAAVRDSIVGVQEGLAAVAFPAGAIVSYVSASPPAGWHLCDGSAHGSAALAALIGPNTPDLRNRFILGSGSRAIGAVGGAETHTLSEAEMPWHNHGGSSHGVSVGHTHWGPSEAVMWITNYYDGSPGGNYTVAGSWAGGRQSEGQSNDHSHGINASGSNAAHNNMPPFYVLTYIVKG